MASSSWRCCVAVFSSFVGSITDRLIPLYAVGAFLAFTLSQAGMVMHWRKNRGPNWLKSALVNGLGALVTGVTTGVVLVAKFTQGAWITLLFIPLTIVFFAVVRRHYHAVKVLTTCKVPVDAAGLSQYPIAVIAIDRWSHPSLADPRVPTPFERHRSRRVPLGIKMFSPRYSGRITQRKEA